jgi:hypothetical protein
MLYQLGQAGWSGQNSLIESHANNQDYMGLAPYFGNLTIYNTTEEQFGPLYL